MKGLCYMHRLGQKSTGKITVRSSSSSTGQLMVSASPSLVKQEEHSICSEQSWFYAVMLQEIPRQNFISSEVLPGATDSQAQHKNIFWRYSECSTNTLKSITAPPFTDKVIHSCYLIGHKAYLYMDITHQQIARATCSITRSHRKC